MVGDRSHDIEGAHANGGMAIGVSWGYANPGELHHGQGRRDRRDSVASCQPR